jgi:NADH-quinone oxidoreductase subunit J
MTALQVIFYIFSATAIFSGLMVVASSNPVRGALFLVLTFFATAGLWILLHAEFLALVLVLVYVGAVMTLFLFVVMMLSVSRVKLQEGFVRYLPLAAVIVLLVVGLMIMVLGANRFGLTQMPMPVAQPAGYSNIASLGMVLYTQYVYPFEISAVLLLTAIVAAISLTHRKAKKSKAQIASEQIAVRSADRVRLVNMPSEPKNNPQGDPLT